uniref:Eukaryotic translation initiation factor 3 subunit J n=1 Tax=Araucaria cunninghamii TaxID=56994 RepID=A0A0D6R7V9_ARACU
MDDDWESEDFVPVAPIAAKEKPKSTWDDEDAEEEDVRESWEDEDQPTPVVKPEPAPALAKPEKKKDVESKVKNAKVQEENKALSMKGKSAKVQDERLADPLAEKLRQQRLVEEADFQATTELFHKHSGEKSLDNFIPKSEADFLEYAELIGHKLRPYEKSFHYLTLLKAVIRLAMTSLKAADAKEVASSVTVTANEKIKAEKEATAGKKKTGSKKKQLLVDRADDDAFVGAYDDINDYDFM